MLALGVADAGWLFALPEFKVLWPVVVPDAVEVMDVLGGKQEAPQFLLHNESVLEDVSPSSRSANPRGMVGDKHLDVPVASADTPATPIRGVLHSPGRRGLGRVPAMVSDGDVGLNKMVAHGCHVYSELSSEAGERVGFLVQFAQFLNGHGEALTGLRSSGRTAVSPESVIMSTAPSVGHDSVFTVSNRTVHVAPLMAIIA